MLDAAIKTQLATHFARLTRAVELSAALDDSPASQETRALLDELAAISGNIVLARAADARIPSFGVAPAGEAPRVRFAGAPMGHEFTSLILAILHAGGVAPKVDAQTIAAIAALPAGLVFETVYSQSCHNCPEVVQALDLIAALNPGVRHTAIDGARFQAEVEARGVKAVPAVFLDGAPFAHGRMGLEDIIAKLDNGASARAAAELATRAPYDVLVVGGGPAGAAAAIYAARKGIRTGLVAERLGGQVGDTMAIENLIAVAETDGPKLAAALERNVRAYGVDVIERQRVTALQPAGADGLSRITLDSGATLAARSIVLAPGARWRTLGVPGEDAYRNKGVAFCPHCDGPLFRGKRVAVIGGGNSGVEAAIDLAGLASEVTLVEFDARLRADAVLQDRLRALPNVRVITSAQTSEVIGNGTGVTGLAYTDRASGAARQIPLDGVFVQIGLVPNTEWLKGTLALTPRGEIEVDAAGRTALPGIFAAGDATTTPYKQIVTAMGDGAKAALAAFDHLIRLAPASLAAAA